MSAFRNAEQQLHAAQRQETQLSEMLRAAQQRTVYRTREFAAAEARLREATEQLAATQSLCHYLASQIALHAKCQRSALLLTPSSTSNGTPPPSRTSSASDVEGNRHEAQLPSSREQQQQQQQQQLCWMDPYSVLHVPSGKVFSYDLVTAFGADALDDPPENEGIREGEGCEDRRADDSVLCDEDGVFDGVRTRASLVSLLKDVVHDALQGFHYTLLETRTSSTAVYSDTLFTSTSSKRSAEGEDSCEQQTHVDTGRLPSQQSVTTGQLTHRLLELLQTEAVQCGTQRLSVSFAVGRVAKSSVAAAAHIEDLLRPLVDQQNAPSRGGLRRSGGAARQTVSTVLMDAVMCEAEDDGERCPRGASPWRRGTVSHGTARRSSSRARFSPINANITQQHATAASKPLPAPFSCTTAATTTLTGVQVRSLAEVDDWLERVGLPPFKTDDSVGAWSSAPCIVLVGVDSQDAAGKVHKSLLRIVSDAAFTASLPATELARGAPAKGDTASKRGASDNALHHTSPPQALTSLFGCFMLHAVAAVLRAAYKPQGLTNTSEDAPALLSFAALHEGDGGDDEAPDLESFVEQLLAQPHSSPSATEIRAAVLSIVNCPDEVGNHCATAAAAAAVEGRTTQDISAEWRLWAALLRPVFGGNSKALWLHTARSAADASSTDGLYKTGERGVPFRPDKGRRRSEAAPFSADAALGLCALFCRLVRHAAVPSAVSADLDRLLREGRL
ncbi:hypothetical protein ABB37_07987 [Leptomonas pyrrhocoris]|uniref:Uncharacterized protein n=1 Tax=Leptomonas pyrrhocoris TaxID=157538 RepID=A0A0N0VDQ7_LEPPY|nr:hypothetical protein ABB37_07987 [Leptomonas pyrrhocoris]KPA76244.1 hypothetical protein ABB37_07987 [Leptomonas pyrrhocoris]|eukprot:XP_015654683.1 hypothetical protein ABB37_07987 [Leptomonas pyrrhocoris]